MRLWICEGLHRSVRVVPHSRVMESGRVSVARLVNVPSYWIIVVNGDSFHGRFAWSNAVVTGMSAVDTVRYRVHLLEMGYSLPDAIHFFRDFKPRFLKPPSASTENGLQSVLVEAHSNIIPSQKDETEERAARRPLSSQDRAAPAAPVGPS